MWHKFSHYLFIGNLFLKNLLPLLFSFYTPRCFVFCQHAFCIVVFCTKFHYDVFHQESYFTLPFQMPLHATVFSDLSVDHLLPRNDVHAYKISRKFLLQRIQSSLHFRHSFLFVPSHIRMLNQCHRSFFLNFATRHVSFLIRDVSYDNIT